MPGGEAPSTGTLVRNPAYAAVLRRLVVPGRGGAGAAARRASTRRAAMEDGLVAAGGRRFSSRPHRHSSGGDHAGVITAADFAGFDAGYEAAVTAEFRGYTVAKAGAWAQGPRPAADPGHPRHRRTADLDPSTARARTPSSRR